MNSLFRKINLKNVIGLSLVVFGAAVSIVYAVNTPNFTLKINPGTLAIDIVDVDNDYASISAPVFNFNSVSSSMECLTGANAPTMILGDAVVVGAKEEPTTGGYIYVSNPDASSDGFTVSLAASNGNTAQWTTSLEPVTQFDFNTTDCANGRMYVDPSTATIANGKCIGNGCNTSGLSRGNASSFNYGVVDSITLVQADASANNIADYVVSGINVSQTIPAFVSSGEYSLDMTMSIISSGNSEGVAAGPTVTYGGVSVTGGNVYVGIRDFSDPVFLVSSDGISLNWSLVSVIDGYNVSSSDGLTASVASLGDINYIQPADITVRATNPNDNTTSDIIIHFGTGYLCGNGSWVANSIDCPADIQN